MLDISLCLRNGAVTLPLYGICLALLHARRKDWKACLPGLCGAVLLCLAMQGVFVATGITPLSGFHLCPDFSTISWNAVESLRRMARAGGLYSLLNIGGNILLMMPLGFFLPLLCRKNQHIWKTTLYGALVSFFIEFWQMFLMRSADAADLCLNTLGSLLGYVIYRLFAAIFPAFAVRFSGESAAAQRTEQWQLFLAVVIPALVTIGLGFFDRWRYFAC